MSVLTSVVWQQGYVRQGKKKKNGDQINLCYLEQLQFAFAFFFNYFGFLLFSFGVCCVIAVFNSGSIVNRNCSYIRNPNYPATYGDTAAVTYTIAKCQCGENLEEKSLK